MTGESDTADRAAPPKQARWWPRHYQPLEIAELQPSTVDEDGLQVALDEILRQAGRQERAFGTLASISTALIGFAGVSGAIFIGGSARVTSGLGVASTIVVSLAVLFGLAGLAMQSRSRPGANAATILPSLASVEGWRATLSIATIWSRVVHRADFDLRRIRTVVYAGVALFTLGWLLSAAGFAISAFEDPVTDPVKVVICDTNGRCDAP